MDGPDPGSILPGEMGRRRLFRWVIGLLAVPMTAVLGGSLAASLMGPMYRRTKRGFVQVLGFDRAPEGRPVRLHCAFSRTDAYLRQDVLEDVWVVKHSPTRVTVFSPVCPHLSCRYDWDPRRQRFSCPCHDSTFSPDGGVLGGPAPRSLDTLPCRIEGDTLWVEWEQYEPGVSGKIRVG